MILRQPVDSCVSKRNAKNPLHRLRRWGKEKPMADDEFEVPEVWDEYKWERFLQQQDQNTEKYFGLLEKYFDHPERDEITAREMGCEVPDEEEEASWEKVAGDLCQEEVEQSSEEVCSEDEFDEFSR